MPASIPTTSLVLMEGLTYLRDQVMGPSFVNTQYTQELGKKVGHSITIPVPPVYTSYSFSDGDSVTEQDLYEDTVQVSIDDHRDTTLRVSSEDLALKPVQIAEKHMPSAIDALVKPIEINIWSRTKEVYNYIADLTGAPDTFTDLAKIKKFAQRANMPAEQRYAVVDDNTEISLFDIPEVKQADKRGDGGQAVRDAEIGRVAGVRYFSNQFLPEKAPVSANNGLTGTVVLDSAVSKGDTSITISGHDATTPDNVQDGDIIDFGDGKRVVVKGDQELNTASFDVAIYASWFDIPALDSQSNPTEVQSHNNISYNVVMHPTAISFVTAPLPTIDGQNLESMVDPVSNVSLRLHAGDYDGTTKRVKWSLDVLYGSDLVRPELIARFDGPRL